MTKTLNQIIIFSSTKIRIFFSATLGIRIFFLEKKHNPPFQVKWSFPYLLQNILNYLALQFFLTMFVTIAQTHSRQPC